MYIYVYICMYIYVCVCAGGRAGGRRGGVSHDRRECGGGGRVTAPRRSPHRESRRASHGGNRRRCNSAATFRNAETSARAPQACRMRIKGYEECELRGTARGRLFTGDRCGGGTLDRTLDTLYSSVSWGGGCVAIPTAARRCPHSSHLLSPPARPRTRQMHPPQAQARARPRTSAMQEIRRE